MTDTFEKIISKERNIISKRKKNIINKIKKIETFNSGLYYRLLWQIEISQFDKFPKHKEVNVYNHKYQKHINIDAKIAKLICHMWYADINTIESCENFFPKKYIWISFESIIDIKRFLSIVFWKVEFTSDIRQRAFWISSWSNW